MTTETTESAVIRDLTRATETPREIPGTGGMQYLVAGHIVNVEAFQAGPVRTRGVVDAHTLDGLVDYVADFRHEALMPGDALRMYLTSNPMQGTYRVEAVLNDSTRDTPGWADHVVTFDAALDPNWVRWHQRDGIWMDQEDTVEWLIDNDDLIVRPVAAELLELVSDFQQITTTRFESSKSQSNGLRKLVFREDDGTPQELRVPDTIEIGVPVYLGGPAYQMVVRIKTVASDGMVRFSFVRVRPDRIIAEAQKEMTEKIREALPDHSFVEAARRSVPQARVVRES